MPKPIRRRTHEAQKAEPIRLILEYVEENSTGIGTVLKRPTIDGYSPEQVSYHMVLCHEAGCVHYAPDTKALSTLTWKGHEALKRFRTNPHI